MKTLSDSRFFRPVLGASFTALCGLLLGSTPLGDAWVNASYDYLFRFGSHAVTNKVVLVQMDNEAFDHFHQVRDQPWDRALHARLLERLAADGCSLVVFDSFFRTPRDPASDQALAEAMRRQQRVVLMAEQAQVTHPTLAGARPTLPCEPFLSAPPDRTGASPGSTRTSIPSCAGIGHTRLPDPMPACHGPPHAWPASKSATNRRNDGCVTTAGTAPGHA